MIILRQKEFSFLDWINKKIDPNWKTQKEQEEKRRQTREKEKQDRLNRVASISRQHKIALEIEKESSKYYPTWGDGDEYPTFFVYKYEGDRYGNICLGYQNEEEYHWNGKYWEEIAMQLHPRRVNNLKQDILKNLKQYRKEYSEINYLDKEDIDEVLVYLDKLISIINKSSL